MQIENIWRDRDCPCGSGLLYHDCCASKRRSVSHAQKVSALVQEMMQDRQFDSLDEAQACLDELVEELNNKKLEEFQGLSSSQMFIMLYFPFEGTDIISFADDLNEIPSAPILKLFELLVEAIGEKGLKPTATGNLPVKFLRESADKYFTEEEYKKRFHIWKIRTEPEFEEMHTARTVAEIAGLIRKYKGKFILSSKCKKMLKANDIIQIYLLLFKTYIIDFNWSYRVNREVGFQQRHLHILFSYFLSLVANGILLNIMKIYSLKHFHRCLMI